MIELYSHPMSPCAQKVRIVLAEKQLAFETHNVDLANKENLSLQYLRLNPQGVVPTLVHAGVVVTESSIICEYIEDAFPSPPLTPSAPSQRAAMRHWMKHVDNKLHPACGALQWPLIMAPKLLNKSEEERDKLIDAIPDAARRERQRRLLTHGFTAPDVAQAVQTYRETILQMEEALQDRDWLSGTEFGLADASVAPYFQTLHQFGWRKDFLVARARVETWYDRCRSRASYHAAILADLSPERELVLLGEGARVRDLLRGHLALGRD